MSNLLFSLLCLEQGAQVAGFSEIRWNLLNQIQEVGERRTVLRPTAVS